MEGEFFGIDPARTHRAELERLQARLERLQARYSDCQRCPAMSVTTTSPHGLADTTWMIACPIHSTTRCHHHQQVCCDSPDLVDIGSLREPGQQYCTNCHRWITGQPISAAVKKNPEPKPTEPKPTLRIADADRQAAAETLAVHAGAGRLTLTELDERVTAVWAARTAEELRPLFADLPAPHPPALWVLSPTVPNPGIPERSSRRRRLVPSPVGAGIGGVLGCLITWQWDGLWGLLFTVLLMICGHFIARGPRR